MIGPGPGPIILPPSTLPLVAPVDEPAGVPIEGVRRHPSTEAPTPTVEPIQLTGPDPAPVAAAEPGLPPALEGPRPDPRTERPAGERSATCTTAQLRRFIKSRAYVPMHEIRRRFLIVSEDDDVTGLSVEGSRIFVGLPDREGQMLGELFRSGEIGYELQLDPRTPAVVGVYPMRPVSRT